MGPLFFVELESVVIVVVSKSAVFPFPVGLTPVYPTKCYRPSLTTPISFLLKRSSLLAASNILPYVIGSACHQRCLKISQRSTHHLGAPADSALTLLSPSHQRYIWYFEISQPIASSHHRVLSNWYGLSLLLSSNLLGFYSSSRSPLSLHFHAIVSQPPMSPLDFRNILVAGQLAPSNSV